MDIAMLPSFARIVVLLSLGLVWLTACAGGSGYVWVEELSPADLRAESDPTIRPGDTLSVIVRQQSTLSGTFLVQSDGRYTQPLVGHIPVAGLTTEEVQTRLAEQLKGIVVEPRVSVAIGVPRPRRIAVAGEVTGPGRFELQPGDGILEALALAGGFTEYSRTDRIFVLRPAPRQLRVRFDFDVLAGGDLRSRAFELRDGDVVLVE